MFRYRFTALILPAILFAFLPALAAYPWQIPLGGSMAFPFLTVLLVLFCALRYPGLLPSPLIFCSGMACDLFTRSPLGYWTFIMLCALTLARFTTPLKESSGRLVGVVSMFILPVIIVIIAWALASLYQFSWQSPQSAIEGMVMALAFLIAPLLLLTGLETALILKKQIDPVRTFGRFRR